MPTLGLMSRDDADWMIEIEGFLGIVDILGIQHLMVIVAKQEVACLPHKQENPASIYELQEIELIPFVDDSHDASPLKQPIEY